MTATGLDAEAIVEWCGPDEIDMVGEPETFVRLREGRRLMVLAHAQGACRFLRDELCTVRPHRPTACAAFPFFIEANGASVGRLPSPCGPAAEPGSFELRSSVCALAPLSRALAAELRIYVWRVESWDRRQRRRLRLHRPPQSSAAFFAHLRRYW
jgi:Fe-S-cluster containining protein